MSATIWKQDRIKISFSPSHWDGCFHCAAMLNTHGIKVEHTERQGTVIEQYTCEVSWEQFEMLEAYCKRVGGVEIRPGIF